jgi:hypothetical protein
MTSVVPPRAQPELARYTCSARGAAHPGSEARWRCHCNGVLDEPTGAVSLTGLRTLRGRALDDVVGPSPVVILTGFGLKAGRQIADLRDPGWWQVTA